MSPDRWRSYQRSDGSLYTTGPVWTTDEDYLALMRRGLPEQNRVLKLNGMFMMRPFKSARPAVKKLALEFGFQFIGMQKTTDDVQRDWMLFKKVRHIDVADDGADRGEAVD